MSKLFNLSIFAVILFMNTDTFAQSTPPKESPMKMRPEMTEIWEPEVKVVTPGKTNSDAPSDAIVLFDGKNLNHWVSKRDPSKPAPWKIVNNEYLEVAPRSGDIQTKMKFGDCQLHIEWQAPEVIKGEGQGRGNSGVFLQNRYEIQILDSHNNRTYANGQAGSIYKDHRPLVNATKSNLEWNTYDIIYRAPRFKADGRIDSPATVTVLHNGVVVQDNATINGLTLYIGLHDYPEAHGEDVIALQDHGDLVKFRNIWIRRL